MTPAKSKPLAALLLAFGLATSQTSAGDATKTFADDSLPQPPLAVNPAPIASNKAVKWDYDIVYVRVPRFRGTNAKGQKQDSHWAEIGHPTQAPPGADLVLLYPDGREEVLVEAGKGSVQDPYVSFDGEWVYYSLFHDPQAGEWTAGGDVYKIHVKSRKVVRLTDPQATPNTGVAEWSKDFKTRQPGKVTVPHGIYNIHPCPLPGGNSFTETMSLRASPYVWMFQSRRSLLVWKILGRRSDGLPDKPLPGHESQHKAAKAIDFTGSIMPPPKAVEGTYEGPDGRKIKVAPLSDEDRRTLIRWIDLGCPIDLDYDPAKP
jgi:hypothetical protein